MVMARIEREVTSPGKGFAKTLTGWTRDNRFQLTIRLRRQQMFMPVIDGSVEATSKGSLIFLAYSLFPATRLLLTFWTLILPLVGIFTSHQYKNYWILAGCLGFATVIHLIAWANFRLHIKRTREMLHELLNEQ
jgi:hypothetical protein